MLRTLYNALWYPAAPLIRRYLRRRAQLSPAYLEHWNERFGGAYPNPVQRPIWIHAVSVGETRAAAPLAAELQARFPDAPLLFTQMTPTGRTAAQTLYPQAQCRYLPYDRADWAAAFLRGHRPRFGILMETEIWPNLMHEAAAQHIPLFLANARLSEKSQRGYRRIRSLAAPALATLSGCFAQTEADAERLRSIGARNPLVCGNTKYDVAPPAAMQALGRQFRSLIGSRPVFAAASTRFYHGQDEAALILEAWRHQDTENSLLVLVPRHPERFQAAFDTAAALGLRVQKRSSGEAVRSDTQIWIGDSMGELFAYYTAADAAFVGGSLVDSGCQNIIEPLSCGLPVLFGPSTYNFQAACQSAAEAGAALQIGSADELAATAARWLARPDERERHARRAAAFIRSHQGAAKRMADEIAQALEQAA